MVGAAVAQRQDGVHGVRLDRAGPDQVQPDQQDRQVGEVLHEPDQPLSEQHAEQHAHRARGPAGRPQGEPEGQRDADQQEDQVGVELAQRLRVQPVAAGRWIAGVGSAAGDDRADGEGRGHQHEQPGGQATELRGDQPDGRGVALAGALVQHDRDGDQGHRQQQVQPDGPRVEAGQDGDPAEPGLGGDAQGAHDRKAPHAGTHRSLPPHGHQRGDDHREQHEGQQPVGELDDAVDGVLRGRRDGGLGAPRPGGAAQA